ncbi:MAG: hypothetical protein R6U95_02560 [Bacteroidales bacterium]
MKKIYFVLILITSYACSNINDLTSFTANYEQQFTIPGSVDKDSPTDIQTPDITTKTESLYQTNNTSKKLIESILLSEMHINHIFPSNGDIGFISSIEVFINADNLEENKIAYKLNIPESVGDTIKLETTDVNVKEYLNKDSFNFRVRITTDSTITEEQGLNIYSLYTIKAELLP